MKFITIFMILLSMFNGNRKLALNAEIYTKAVKIENVETIDNKDCYTGVDAAGDVCQWFSGENYYPGDIALLIMSDNCTAENKDDIVLHDSNSGFWFDIDN